MGKTTLIHRFLEREEAPKQTLALEYTFGRKTNQNLIKDVCHIWELGGGTMYTNLIETPLSPDKLTSSAVVLVVDLSKPERMWSTVTSLISSVGEYIGAALKTEEAKRLKVEERLEKEAQARVGEEHGDIKHLQPFPLPLLILGGQYDVFQDFEPEKKKLICRSLRYLAHLHGASLQFYSAKDPGLVKKARDLLSHHGFNTPPGKGMSQVINTFEDNGFYHSPGLQQAADHPDRLGLAAGDPGRRWWRGSQDGRDEAPVWHTLPPGRRISSS